MTAIFIPGQVMSKKNSKKIWCTNGKPVVSSSEHYLKWTKSVKWVWIQYRNEWLKAIKDHPLPLIVGLHFIRKDKSKFDFNNMSQGIMDEIQKAEWIPGDDIANIYAIPVANTKGEIFSIDPKEPGVWLYPIKSITINF